MLISLICHAPAAMVSAKYRVAADGEISTTSDHHFKGARLTGNGPQAIDDQAAKLRQLLDGATQRGRPATTRMAA